MERQIWSSNATAQRDTLSSRYTIDGLGKTNNKHTCSIMGKAARIQEQKGKYSHNFWNH